MMPHKDKEKHNALCRKLYAEMTLVQRAARAEYQRQYRAGNRTTINARERKAKRQRSPATRKYRADYYQRTKEQQRSRRGLPEPTRPCPSACELCGKIQTAKSLCLEHCHTTGKFRGWLCNSCNTGIGLLGDTLEHVKRAAEWLERNS